jgi:hypothetical protein
MAVAVGAEQPAARNDRRGDLPNQKDRQRQEKQRAQTAGHRQHNPYRQREQQAYRRQHVQPQPRRTVPGALVQPDGGKIVRFADLVFEVHRESVTAPDGG